jgi:hypothetical protein
MPHLDFSVERREGLLENRVEKQLLSKAESAKKRDPGLEHCPESAAEASEFAVEDQIPGEGDPKKEAIHSPPKSGLSVEDPPPKIPR